MHRLHSVNPTLCLVSELACTLLTLPSWYHISLCYSGLTHLFYVANELKTHFVYHLACKIHSLISYFSRNRLLSLLYLQSLSDAALKRVAVFCLSPWCKYLSTIWEAWHRERARRAAHPKCKCAPAWLNCAMTVIYIGLKRKKAFMVCLALHHFGSQWQ